MPAASRGPLYSAGFSVSPFLKICSEWLVCGAYIWAVQKRWQKQCSAIDIANSPDMSRKIEGNKTCLDCGETLHTKLGGQGLVVLLCSVHLPFQWTIERLIFLSTCFHDSAHAHDPHHCLHKQVDIWLS